MAPKSKKRKMTVAQPVAQSVTAAPAKKEPPKTTFMDLPVEIRCEIYGYVLEEPTPIKLRIQFHKKKNGPREIVRIFHRRDPKHHGQVYDKKTKSWIPKQYTHSSILLVNRQINEEATPVLFAQNGYFLETTAALRDFLELIGASNVRHLRRIIIGADGYKANNARAAFQALTAAKGLRALEIDHSNLCAPQGRESTTTHRLAGDCRTLLKSLKASYETLNLFGSVLDVLSVTLRPCKAWSHPPPFSTVGHRRGHEGGRRNGSCGCRCEEVEEVNAALQRDLRIAAAKHLGLKDGSNNASAA